MSRSFKLLVPLFALMLAAHVPVAHADDTPMAKEMEVMEDGMSKLRRLLKDPAGKVEALSWIDKIIEASVKSKALIPAMAEKVPEADRAKFVDAYRKDMAIFIAKVCEMEVAVLDGNADKAMEVHKSLKSLEKEGHDKYQAEEESDEAK